jgi:hypothetical protein
MGCRWYGYTATIEQHEALIGSKKVQRSTHSSIVTVIDSFKRSNSNNLNRNSSLDRLPYGIAFTVDVHTAYDADYIHLKI